ncbi:hypothetical protein BDY24DRAFT_389560 [Mrakia frigida]|uniref:Dlt1p n=1 Tax=Mrakia frigida TaxID=29902 RepID=UPI003FCC0B78
MGRRTPLRIFQSVLYHSSFAFLVFLTLVAVAGSAWGLISQAWNTGGQRRWNIVILVAGYGAVLFVSFFICLGRILNIRYTLQTIPRPYIPVKEADLPQSLSRYISGEYTRTAIIAHVQQPTAGTQEGWGAPGSDFPSLHYGTFLLQKLHAINDILPPISELINPTFPPTSASTIPFSPHKIRTLPLFYHPLLKSVYTEPLAKILDIAQYSGRELTAAELEMGIRILWAV